MISTQPSWAPRKEGRIDFKKDMSSPVLDPHAVLVLRMELDKAILQHKTQQLVNLRALSRSLQLRQQLTRARQPQNLPLSSPEQDGNNRIRPTTPAAPLDPSVKALIEKLTEIAELVSGGSNRVVPNRVMLNRAGQVDDNDGSLFEKGEVTEQVTTNVPMETLRESEPGTALKRNADGGPDFGEEEPRYENKPGTALKKNTDGGPDSGGKQHGHVGTNDDVGGWSSDDGEGYHAENRELVDHEAEEVSIAGQRTEDRPIDPSDGLLVVEGEMDPEEATVEQSLEEIDSSVQSLLQDLVDGSNPGADTQDSDGKKSLARERDAAQREADKQRASNKRKAERLALLAQLGGGKLAKLRRPRARWIAIGVPNPTPDQILSGKSLWRAAVFLVIMFFVRPRRNIMQRKARSKERDTQDWNATLTIYFDRCQTWLLKTSRVPVSNSMLKNPKLSLRLGRSEGNVEAYHATANAVGKGAGGSKPRRKRGFVGGLLRAVGRGIVPHENMTTTLMRIKVHAVAIMRGLTQEMPPSDIVTFFSYLAGDSNYFPEGFFFEAETNVLSFDSLGAVRILVSEVDPPDSLEHTLYALHASSDLQDELKADAERHHEGFLEAHHLGWLVPDHHNKDEKRGKAGAAGKTTRTTDLRVAVLHGRDALAGKLRPLYRHDASGRWLDTHLVEMVLTNYIMVRVLIPWVLLHPHLSGLIPSSGVKPSVLTHNCQVLASIVYLIVRVLRPELTPPNLETQEAAVLEEIERARQHALQDEKTRRHSQEDDKAGSGSDGGDSDAESRDSGDEKDAESTEDGGSKARAEDAPKRRLRRNEDKEAEITPLTVQEIMQQKRAVSLSDKQLVRGLLPDSYFIPFVEQLRPWVLEQAAEFDTWVQNVVVMVMSKSASSIRQSKSSEENKS